LSIKHLQINLINTAKSFFSFSDTRSGTVKKNISLSAVVIVLSNLTSFLLVPIAIGYVSSLQYGVWLTILSFINWFNLFDLGLGNGLKNKLGEALANNDLEEARELVSTGYAVIGLISLFLIGLSLIVFPLIPWDRVFNAPAELRLTVERLVRVVFIFFALRFTLQLINPILAAYQKTSITQLNNFLGNGLALTAIFILMKTTSGSLFKLGFSYMLFPVLVYLAVSIYWFSGQFSAIKPSIRLFNKKHLKSIFNLGIMFLINQLAVVVLSTTSSMLISHISGPAKVTPYAVTQRFFFLIITIYGMLTTPLWPAFTEAYAKRDFNWIRRIVAKFNYIWLVLCGVVILMLIVSPLFFKLWLGDKVNIPFTLSCLMVFYVIITAYTNVYSSFLCGVSKIRLATLTSVVFTLLYIPIAIFFAKTLHLGFHGIVLASICVTIPNLYTHPTQYQKLVNGKAAGIWNK
jgi:O-antigen/teichoic acid export membrane protein